MSYRTWLKDVNHLNDIAPWESTLDACHKDWEKMDDVRDSKLFSYWRKPLSEKVQNQGFFNSSMHDSQFIGLSHQKNKAVITLNDLDAETLINDVCRINNLEHPGVVIPIDFVFQDVVYCTSLRHDLNFKLRYDNIATVKPDNSNFQLNFKRDWFFEQDGRLQFVCEIFSWNARQKLSDSIYILIDCSTANAVDRRLPVLKRLFGPNIVPLWNDYLDRIDFPTEPIYYPQYVGGFIDYFNRRLPVHGLTWNDLKFQNP